VAVAVTQAGARAAAALEQQQLQLPARDPCFAHSSSSSGYKTGIVIVEMDYITHVLVLSHGMAAIAGAIMRQTPLTTDS
jgi:hypothetical protein